MTWKSIRIRRWSARGFTSAVFRASCASTWGRTEHAREIFVKLIATLSIVALCVAGCSITPAPGPSTNLLPSLRPYADEVANELDAISNERKVVLGEIAATIAARLEDG